MLRAKSLDDWSRRNGGNIHIMCVEYGCIDAVTNLRRFNGAEGAGISDEDRIQYTFDIRSSFDKYGIGWSYWSYNEAHTVFLPVPRESGKSPSPEKALTMFDYDLLETGLGLKPKK